MFERVKNDIALLTVSVGIYIFLYVWMDVWMDK